jgi:H+/Cl- antiporter ClcA
LCYRFAPNAAGGGPGHVVSALKKLSSNEQNNQDISEFLSFRIMVVKIVSSILCIAGGGALGREGPVVQISASIFALIAQKTKNILPSFDLRTWIVAGSAAGVAAAFNTPLAGIVFAIEELSQSQFERKISGFKTQAFFAVIVSGVTAQIITGSYVLFEFPIMEFRWEMTISILLLIISSSCGVAAFLLKAMVTVTTQWRASVKGRMWYLIPIVSGLIVASVSYKAGVHSFGAGIFTIHEALESSHSLITFQDSLGRFINIIATTISGCAGGLLLPALALGAGIGSLGSTFLPMEDSRIFVATGMAAFLGAMINAPLTAAVLVLEVTNQRELIFPLFLSTLAASWMFQGCNKSCVYLNKFRS